jgi:hypothetical protein
MHIRKIIALSIFIIGLFLSGYIYKSFGAGLPFGGQVTNAFFCSCDGGWLLTIGPPVGGEFLYRDTPQYAYYQLPRTGVWALGLYVPGGVCSFVDGKGCGAIPAQGTITETVGTSL